MDHLYIRDNQIFFTDGIGELTYDISSDHSANNCIYAHIGTDEIAKSHSCWTMPRLKPVPNEGSVTFVRFSLYVIILSPATY